MDSYTSCTGKLQNINNVGDEKMQTKEIIEVATEKNNLAKDLANHREKIAVSSDKRKTDYTKFLYALKESHTTKLFKQSIERITKIHALRKR